MHQSDALWEYFYYDAPGYKKWSKNSLLTENGLYYVLNVKFTIKNAQCIHLDENESNKLLVSSTTFIDLEGHVNGLAIYQKKGSCIQYHVCSINPKSSNNIAHSLVRLQDTDVTTKNYIIESTISNTSSIESAFLQYNGDNRISQINVSNSVAHYNVICATSGAFFNSCTFSGNNATWDRVMHLNYHNAVLSMCNFLSNTDLAKNEFNGLIYHIKKNLKVIKSIFKDNKVKYLFYLGDESGSITVSDCYFIGNEGESSNTANIKIDAIHEFDNILHHLSTENCVAEYPIPFIVNKIKCKTNKINNYLPDLMAFANEIIIFLSFDN